MRRSIRVLGIVSLSTMSQYQSSKIYDSASFAAVNCLPSLLVLDEAFDSIVAMRNRIWQHVVQNDPKVKASLEQGMKEDVQKIEDALKKYEPMIADDKDRELLAAERASLAEYIVARDKAIAFSNAGKFPEARDQVIANAKLASKLFADFNAHRAYNDVLSKNAVNEASATKSRFGIISWTLSGVTIVVVCLVGILLIRNLLGQLGGEPAYVANVLKTVSQGDLSVEVVRKEGDNSSMVFALENTVEQLRSSTGDVARTMQALSEGDLTRTIDKDYPGVFGELKGHINNTVLKLSEIIGEVRGGAEALAGASEEVSATAQSLSQASQRAGRQRRGDERVDRADDGVDLAEHGERQGHRRHGHQGLERGERGRRGGAGDGGGDEADRAEDRHHRRHRLPDQPAGAERGDRGGACGRARQGLRGRGRGGAQAGRTQPGRRRGDRRRRELQRRTRREGRSPARHDRAQHPQDLRPGAGDHRGVRGAVHRRRPDQRRRRRS